MKNLTKQAFATKLTKSYMGVIVPKAMTPYPLEMKDWRKWEEEGNPIDGEYHSIDSLSEEFGKQFTPIPMINENFVYCRWSFRQDENETFLFHSSMEAKGLVHMRKDLDIEDVDFENFPPNGYLVVANDELSEIPRVSEDETV